MRCPKCNEKIDEWQSKYLTYDGYVLANGLQEIKLNEHIDGEMHTLCDNCETFLDVPIVKGQCEQAKLGMPQRK
ncbi:MAG: hypothetical protein Q7S88_02335 [Candidatus Daviesbacteria bacterium]|nr:hypothetical protein [Candidatus Daviesbacteria bacterium]